MKNSAPQSGKTLSTSMFYMWRGVIAVAHADGQVHAAEIAYLEKVFAGIDRAYGLTDEQKKIFAEDLKTPQNLSVLLAHINEPSARAQLIYFAGLLARADGVVSPAEDAILRKLRADQLASLDMTAIRADVKKAVSEDMWKHDLHKGQQRPQTGFAARFDEFLLWLGIDIYS